MKQATFNDFINLEYPDDFQLLSEEENKKYFVGNQLRLSFLYKEKHILISLSKGKDSFMNGLFSVSSIAKSSLSNLSRNLKDYQFIEESSSSTLDQPSITECFSYMAIDQNVKQYGELTVFKVKKAFYAVMCLSRFESKEESKKVFKQFVDSFHL